VIICEQLPLVENEISGRIYDLSIVFGEEKKEHNLILYNFIKGNKKRKVGIFLGQ
jgi:hypothetical protein